MGRAALTEFAFSYRHESSECRLSSRASSAGIEPTFFFSVHNADHSVGRYDGVQLSMRISPDRVRRADLVTAEVLATEILDEIYSHGEPQRRKPSEADRTRLGTSLETWIRENRQ